MHWDRMTMDEFALFQQSEGLKVVQIGGVWWVEIRPFFFRPLFPFTVVDPRSAIYPAKTMVGGFLHLAPEGATANSTMNFFVYDNLKEYNLDALSRKRKKAITEGLRNFTARRITDKDEFVEMAHPVYVSFQRRTKYSYKDERLTRQGFSDWTDNLYRHEKVSKLGAYHEGKLYAIEVSYLVEDVIIGDTLFASDEGLRMQVTDFVYHTLRIAAADTDARYFFAGLPTGVTSLDQSKLTRGCKLLKMPACYRMNPVTLSVVKMFMKSSYHKLQQIIAPPEEQPVALGFAAGGMGGESGQDYQVREK